MKPTTNSNESLLVLFFLIAFLSVIWWGQENTAVALFLIEHPIMILPYLIDKLGYLKLLGGALGAILVIFFLIISSHRSHKPHKKIIRGAKETPARQVKAILKKQPKPRNQPQLVIAGMPIPLWLENRGFFVFGSPGTGKTQAISQMTAIIRGRSDFRAMIFDRNGEMLEKFYDPQKDLIFNPFDARSVHWSHVHEAASPDTIAAGLIPQESSTERFFSDAGRAVMAELFRQTTSNQQLWSLLRSDRRNLNSLFSNTLAARYLEEERAATSILSTASNYCQFYACLTKPQNKALSFYDWGRSNSPRWIFITLRENESELLRPLHSLVFELMLHGLLSNEEPTRKTAIIIDELGALNQLPSLHRLLSESRKSLGCPILGTQTESQIIRVYGQEDTRTILQGTKTKLILNCVDPQTARTMAEIIGRQELIYTAENYSSSHHTGRSGNGRTVAFNEQLQESYAVMPDEIKNLPDLSGYLKIAQYCAPVKLKRKKFPARAKRFVSLSSLSTNHGKQSIQSQWDELEE
jgi:hypothetical protein